MHENRTSYPKAKMQMYEQLQELPKKYKVIALVRMEKVRASQIFTIKKKNSKEKLNLSVSKTKLHKKH